MSSKKKQVSESEDMDSDTEMYNETETEVNNNDSEVESEIGDGSEYEDDEIEDEDDLDDNAEIDDEDHDIDDELGDGCVYDYADMDDDEDLDDIYEDVDLTAVIIPPEKRITKPYMTKYERVRLIGDRTAQLARGAKPMLKNVEYKSPREIAMLELKHKVMPLIIERPLPNGKKERWHISELKF